MLMARVLIPAPSSSQMAGEATRDPVAAGTLGPRKPEVPRPRKTYMDCLGSQMPRMRQITGHSHPSLLPGPFQSS